MKKINKYDSLLARPVCVCVCVCVKEGGRKGEKEEGRERKRTYILEILEIHTKSHRRKLLLKTKRI